MLQCLPAISGVFVCVCLAIGSASPSGAFLPFWCVCLGLFKLWQLLVWVPVDYFWWVCLGLFGHGICQFVCPNLTLLFGTFDIFFGLFFRHFFSDLWYVFLGMLIYFVLKCWSVYICICFFGSVHNCKLLLLRMASVIFLFCFVSKSIFFLVSTVSQPCTLARFCHLPAGIL